MIELFYPLFFLISFFHSSIGLGGGSSYTAILILLGYSYTIAPSISLTLNLFVSAIATFHYYKAKHLSMSIAFPLIACSIPFSYLGGTIILPKKVFLFLLLIFLMIIIVKLQLRIPTRIPTQKRKNNLIISLIIGAILGFFSGLIGIGGGIFLVPILILFRLATIKEAAACGAIFIFFNSFFGLLARYINTNWVINFKEIFILIFIVIFAGYLGSYLGAKKLKPRLLYHILTTILIIISILLILKIIA